MTDTTPPPMPDFPPPPPPAPKKPRNWVIISSATAVIAAVIGTGIVVVQSRGDDSKPTASVTSNAPAEDTLAAAEDASPDPVYEVVGVDSFTVELRTTKRQCFGSAGCNLTVEPEFTYLGVSEDVDPDAVYEITYEIRGDDSGPVIQTAELSDQTSVNYTQTFLSTASSGTKVSVKITDVTKREY